jgi:L-rhamnose mutarotase
LLTMEFSMIRHAFTMRLKPDALPEYKRLHDNIWPELVTEIEHAGIASITTFQRGLELFLVSEVADEAAWDNLWNSEVHRRWAELMQPLLHLRDDGIVDADELDEVFHLTINGGGSNGLASPLEALLGGNLIEGFAPGETVVVSMEEMIIDDPDVEPVTGAPPAEPPAAAPKRRKSASRKPPAKKAHPAKKGKGKKAAPAKKKKAAKKRPAKKAPKKSAKKAPRKAAKKSAPKKSAPKKSKKAPKKRKAARK